MPVVKKSSKIVWHCFQKGLSTQGAYNFNLDLKPGQNPAGADVCLTGKNLFASQWVEIFSDENIVTLIPLLFHKVFLKLHISLLQNSVKFQESTFSSPLINRQYRQTCW